MKHATKYVLGSLDKYQVHEDADGQRPITATNDDNLIWGGAKVLDLEAGLEITAKVRPGKGRIDITELTIKIIDVDPDADLAIPVPAEVRDKFRRPFPKRIDNRIIRGIRIDTIARLVANHIAAQEREPGRSGDPDGLPIYAREVDYGRPTMEQVAADYNSGLGRGQIVAKYGVGEQVIDRLLRKARKAEPPLIPPATTGRGHRKDR